MSNNLPLISVVIPVYNHERFIAQSLESVVAQTYTNLQILIGDDKSTDGSLAVIEKYAAMDQRIEVLYDDENLGICKNFNRLFNAVKGEFVAFFSGDDVMMKDKLMLQYQYLKECADVVVVHHDAKIIDDNGNFIRLHRGKMLPLCNPLDWALKTDWFHAKRIAPLLPTTCLARSSYYLHARYNDNLRYKHELLFTIEDYCNNPKGKWLYIDRPLISYRMHESNFTNNPRFRSYLNEEKFKLARLALQRAPALKKRIQSYKLFMIFETIVYRWYSKEDEKELKQEYRNEAGAMHVLMLQLGVWCRRAGLYPAISKLWHQLLFRPYYLIKYSNYNR